tara:strand:+ start:106 stop:546 length:441 start_codon:yes stop_codon:yes gene_type:complete
MSVKDIMSQDVCYISPECTLQEAAQKMDEKQCGFIAIGKESEGKLSGVITDRDITLRAVAQGKNPQECTVGDIQTSKVLYCFQDDDISEVAQNMASNQVHRLIVLNNREDKRLAGVVTFGDIVRHDHLSEGSTAAEGILEENRRAA